MPIDLQATPGTGFNAEHRVFSDFFADNHIIQNVSIVQPKNLLLDVLRKHFNRDSVYTYRADEYGFPATPDLTGLDIEHPSTTKVLISDVYREEIKFYPAVTIKTAGGSSVPISFNQNATIKYRKDLVESKFGGIREVRTPTHRVYAGAWDMSFEVGVFSESHSELEEITEIVKMILQYSSWNELRADGLFIKSLSVSGEGADPYSNKFVFNHRITISTRSEWRVEIPIENMIEKIVFYFDIKRTPSVGSTTTDADAQALKFNDIIEYAKIGF